MVPQACAAQSGISRTKTTLDHTAMPPQPHSSKPTSGREVQWLAKVEELQQYVVQHGRLPTIHATGQLCRWVNCQRMEYKALQHGKLSVMTPERIAALEAVPGWVWDAWEAHWQEMYQRVLRQVVQGGKFPKPCDGDAYHWLQGNARLTSPSSRAGLSEATG